MKLLFTSLQLLLTLCAFAQERVNKALPDISPTIISQLGDVTGWSLNPEGQWVSRKNKIPKQLEKQYEKLLDSYKYGRGIDSFNNWEQRLVTINNQEYNVLIKSYTTGAYRYPKTEQDYFEMKGMHYYVFDKKELEKLKNLKANQPNLIVIDAIYSNGNAPLNNLEDLKLQMVKDIEKGSQFKKSLVLNIAPYPQKDIIQFLLFGIMSDGTYKYYDLNEYRNSVYYDKKKPVLFDEPEIFKEAYYETNFKTFQAFLPIEVH